MFSRISLRWFVPLLLLAACGVGLAYNRIAATSSDPAVAAQRSGRFTTVDAPRKKQHPVVMPKIDWKHGEPWPGEWIKYAPDNELPHGLTIEVAQGVITAIAKDGIDQRDYDILGTRYVIGDLDATDITPALWRSLNFEMPKPDGSVTELGVLRPLWWIEKTGAKVGETIDLGMHEIGISGSAKVLSIGSCSVDSRDNPDGSQIVTGKIKHHNADVWDLVFNNDTKKPLGVTANHPIYSLDRNDWVPAGELRIDEKVRTIDGTATLTSRSERPGRETVYNLEVHRSHAYHVSQLGILAHNSNILDCTKTAIFRGDGTKLARAIDMRIDKKTGLLIPEKTGLSLNLDQSKLLERFSTAPRVKSIPDELQIIQQGKKDLGHYGISPKVPMTPERFQELLNLVEFF